MRYVLISIMSLFLASQVAVAEEANQTGDKAIQELQLALLKNMPQAAGASIKATPINGLYEVMSGPQILYMTKDARFVIDGDMFDLQTRVNLTEDTRAIIRKSELDKLGEANMLVYKPEGDVKHTITVFTDIYCPYCRRLHEEMKDYMAGGVKVRYVFLPFKGKRSYDTSVSVWCAKNPQQALDQAKAGEEVEAKTCENPIEQHRAMAQAIGIRGTPAIMYENGLLNPGYVPANKVIEQLESLGL
ncbi:MAG: DsbC family protein [Gammaproteobacteria bacterium]|nr:DsbC family protein [Gammaproteobacteria bacterium]